MLCVERRRLQGHVITAFKYVKGCSKEKYNSCSPRPLGIKQEIIGLNCTEGDSGLNASLNAYQHAWLSTGTDNPGLLQGLPAHVGKDGAAQDQDHTPSMWFHKEQIHRTPSHALSTGPEFA